LTILLGRKFLPGWVAVLENLVELLFCISLIGRDRLALCGIFEVGSICLKFLDEGRGFLLNRLKFLLVWLLIPDRKS